MLKKIVTAVIGAAFLGGGIVADEQKGDQVEGQSTEQVEKKKLTRSEKRLARLHEKYQATGKTKRCVSLNRLRESTIIDDQTIFFRGNGRAGYVNRLPRKCHRLATEERFAYSTSIGQLCKHEILTVLDSFGHSWNRCGLGEFEVWEKKPKEEKAKAANQ